MLMLKFDYNEHNRIHDFDIKSFIKTFINKYIKL